MPNPCPMIMYWLVFFSVIAGGNVGIYIGVSSLEKYQTPAIFGFMAAYTVAIIILMCGITAGCACLFYTRDQCSDQNDDNKRINIQIY